MTPSRLISVLSSLLLPAGLAFAQSQPQTPAAPAPAAARPATPFRSPEVGADRRVTFRLRAPNAREVFVTGVGARLPMQKDAQGIWVATSEPLAPEIYSYAFSVDGATFSDPANPELVTVFLNGGRSRVTVPGGAAWDPAPGPKGTISHHFYRSGVIGDDRDFYVYTPPNYDAARRQPYPVLYLLHGYTDDAYGWISAGNANVILDNLINQGKAVPMIMVNTLGYGTADMMTSGRGAAGAGDQMMPNFTKALLTEVMPEVERRYNASKNRADRAIAGLSMGGAEALFAGLNHVDQFAYVASFSGGFTMWPGANSTAGPAPGGPRTMDAAAFDRNFPGFDAKAASQLRLLWVVCGADDGLIGVNRQFKDWLTSKNVAFTGTETPGFAHVWPLWRRDLTGLAAQLFQKK